MPAGLRWSNISSIMPIDNPTQSLANLKIERDAIALYDALATIEKDPRRAEAFHRIADNERRHAAIWADKLTALGVVVPPPGAPRLRVRFIILLARLLGTNAVSDLVKALEGDEEAEYSAQEATDEVASIAADEREHAEIWKRLDAHRNPTDRPAAVDPVEDDDVEREEPWHKAGQSGTLRAVIFGVSDGLVSNTSLVMGVAGAASGDGKFILLAGVSGLLAGSFSMAVGEYISMTSQRELFERQITLEREELKAVPEEEEAELARIYRRKGFTPDEAKQVAHRLFQDPEHALDTLVREELGLDPDELGSPWSAAFGSFLAFAAGAVVPVIPFVFGSGTAIVVASIALALLAMFGVGGAVSLLTGKSFLRAGLRQVVVGLAAAAVTYGVGRLIGVSVT